MKKTGLVAAFFIGLFAAQESFAGDYWLNIHIGSNHLEGTQWYYLDQLSEEELQYLERYSHERALEILQQDGRLVVGEYNEQNFGIGLGYELTSWLEPRFGYFRNSFNNNSFYFGASIHTSYQRFVSVGLQIGGVTGYKDVVKDPKYDNTVQPLILPTLMFHMKQARAELGYIPKDQSPGSTDVLTLTIGFKF